MTKYYADLEFTESQLDSVSAFVDLNDPYALESLLQEFVIYSIRTGILRYYVESCSTVPDECSQSE